LKPTVVWQQARNRDGRPPHGGRGLKPSTGVIGICLIMSPPARGAWIETV